MNCCMPCRAMGKEGDYGTFDVFKKKDCEICGKEVGLLGYKKLQDGEICKGCVKLHSPWFEDCRESTVAQIKEQLAYREQNARELEGFTVSRTIGDTYKMYIEDVDGVPTRFFVTSSSDYMKANPDIISFKDVMSCLTDVQVRDEEVKQEDGEGKMVSCEPPRYKHHHDFYIKMEINNPYFDDIRFRINGSTITLEAIGDVGGGLGGAALAGLLEGVGVNTAGAQTPSYQNSSENRRYEQCRMMCQRIEQAVEDGKRGTATVAQDTSVESLLTMIGQIKGAPDLLSATTIAAEVARQMTVLSDSDWERVKALCDGAVAEAKLRFGCQEPADTPVSSGSAESCPNCGVPKAEPNPGQAAGWTCFCGTVNTGKFCAECGTQQFEPSWIWCSECSWTTEDEDDPTVVPKFCPNCGRQFNNDDVR